MQSPKMIYRAIARTLSTKNQPSKLIESNELLDVNELFETNRIEDIQASSILRSLMESYSHEHLANISVEAGLATPEDYLSHYGGDEDDLKSMGSCTNYADFEHEDENNENENNRTFLVMNDEEEEEEAKQSSAAAAVHNQHLNSQINQLFHPSQFKKRKVNYEIKADKNDSFTWEKLDILDFIFNYLKI